MRGIVLVTLLGVFATVALADLSEKIQKKLESVESTYKVAVEKADNVRFYAVQKATGERLRALKLALTEATKAGDFEGATKLQERVKAAEADSVRTKPKEVVRFGGNEYALTEVWSTGCQLEAVSSTIGLPETELPMFASGRSNSRRRRSGVE